MNILGIETSCDETAVAVVENGVKVLSSVIATSADMHTLSGGIIPENAARKQIESIIPVVDKALSEAFPKLKNLESRIQNLDSIAVTYGPGLIGSLIVGIETAKTLSYLWNKPLIPVNHLVAHIYANFVGVTESEKLKTKSLPKFPAVALVVSGGHTDMVLMSGHGKMKWIGGTRDDAAGECFDKCARLLNLPYPGGPSISAEAEKWQMQNDKCKMDLFPRPMINSKNLDMSFSGLKTAVYNYLQTEDKMLSRARQSAEIQEAIVDVIVEKSLSAIDTYRPKSFLLSGGVAANARLRQKLELAIEDSRVDVDLRIPKPNLCTDNGVVVASAAYFNYSKVTWETIVTDPQLEIV